MTTYSYTFGDWRILMTEHGDKTTTSLFYRGEVVPCDGLTLAFHGDVDTKRHDVTLTIRMNDTKAVREVIP